MADDKTKPTAPDLSHGISLADLPDGRMLIGHVESEEILLVRVGDEVFAVSPHCTHYHGPLAEGLVIETALRCPWHHACFDLRTGNALRAPAIDPIACWNVEQREGRRTIHQWDTNARKHNDRMGTIDCPTSC